MTRPLITVAFMCALVLVPVLITAPERMRERANHDAGFTAMIEALDRAKYDPEFRAMLLEGFNKP